MRRMLLLPLALASACATTGRGGVSHSARMDLAGTLVLVDGTVVPRAAIEVRCGQVIQSVRTDEQGRFVAKQVPEGTCTVTCEAAGLRETVRVGANVLRRTTDVRLTIPPMHRVELELRSASLDGTVLLDETLPYPVAIPGHELALRDRHLVDKGRRLAPIERLALGQEFQSGDLKLKIKLVEPRPWMPLKLRGAPRGFELSVLPLLHGDRQVVRLGFATRNVLLLARCEALREDMLDELESMAGTYAASGLRVAAILVEACPKAAPWIGRRSYPLLLGGAELLWAMQARGNEVVVVDGDGRALWRRPLQQIGPLDDAVAYLSKSWPTFAAVRRVSLSRSSTVQAAETERLLAQAEVAVKAGKHKEAHQLLDQVLQLAPNLAEARKQRALTKARLGDLSGAMREVSWWRSSFGTESADDLLDEVQRCAKVQTLR
jgi:hypothetical protein